jgi:hypothetical protein
MTKLNGLVNRVATAALEKSCYFCLATPNMTAATGSSTGNITPPPTPRVVPTSRGSISHM